MYASTLTEYLAQYSEQMIAQLESAAEPLVRSGGPRPAIELLREPMAAQWERIKAAVATWRENRDSAVLSAAMGTGKTLMGAVAVHLHAKGKPYRSLVICPPHLTAKWKRELEITLPDVEVTIIDHYSDVLAIKGTRPTGSQWFVASSSKAKLGCEWRPAYVKKLTGVLHCPTCDNAIYKIDTVGGDKIRRVAQHPDLEKRQQRCDNCGEALYQWKKSFDRWPVAALVNRKLRHVFKYLVLDEAHEMRSETTATGHSAGQLCAAIKHKLWLTGTLLNGYSQSIFPMCYRAFPGKMKALDLQWGESMEFCKRYGRLETITTYKGETKSNRQSQGGTKSTSVRVRPGIVPSLYGDCLLENTIFCELNDLGFPLPPLREVLEQVEMDSEMASEYQQLESEVKQNLTAAIEAGSKRALSLMLNTLIGWPDQPWGYDTIGYQDEGTWVDVAYPAKLSESVIRNKEKRLIEVIRDNRQRGRQCWVYVQMTDTRDVQPRIKTLLETEGFDVRILRSNTVPTDRREKWIYANGKADVIISHPALVQTGLDLFDAKGNHNFSTLIFYQTGYQLDTLRQAAARSHRIGQKLDCEVWYLYYARTMQENAVQLMSQKTSAAQAVEGKFSAAGLASLMQGSESVAMQLARHLAGLPARLREPTAPVSVKPGTYDTLLGWPKIILDEVRREQRGELLPGTARKRLERLEKAAQDLKPPYQALFWSQVDITALRTAVSRTSHVRVGV